MVTGSATHTLINQRIAKPARLTASEKRMGDGTVSTAVASAITCIHLVVMSDARRMDYNVVHQLLTAVETQCVKEPRTALIAKSIVDRDRSQIVGTAFAIRVRTAATARKIVETARAVGRTPHARTTVTVARGSAR